MLLNLTPSGHELQRKMLLEHSSIIRTVFICSLVVLILVPICVGFCFTRSNTETDYMCNVAMILVNNGEDYMTGESNTSQGTAFLIANSDGSTDGYMLTARHVIDGTVQKEVALIFPDIINENDEPLITTASLVWTTNVQFDGNDVNTLRYDVALLKLDDVSILPENVTGFLIGTEVAPKQEISIYGFPYEEGYAKDGQIANNSFKNTEDLFTLDFEIDHGASGAPIYREDTGEALGIAIASATYTDLQNICISLKRALELMDQDGVKNLID